MREGPSTFRPGAPILELVRWMQENDLKAVPVTTAEGRLLGLFRRDEAEAVLKRIHLIRHRQAPWR
jgi:Mg/Co/Ni transporter MgtE